MKQELLDKQVITLKYNGERIKIRLANELAINRDKLTELLQSQPSKYGFLITLRAHLQRISNDMELEATIAYGKAYKAAKKKPGSTGRGLSNEDARIEADLDDDYLLKMRDSNAAKENLQLIDGCVKAFEQRASILQTLSANQRKERE